MGRDAATEIEKQGEEFLKTLNKETYLNLAGLKKEINTITIHKSHPDFGDAGLFLSMKDSIPTDKKLEDIEARGRCLLLGFLARSFIESKTAHIMDKILTIESGTTIQVEQTVIPFRSVRAEMKKEPKKSKREELERKRKGILSRLNPLWTRSWDIAHDSAGELGLSSYAGLWDEIEDLNLIELEEKAKTFLDDTEYICRDMLSWFLLKRMELRLKDAASHDLDYLLSSFELRANFPKNDLNALARLMLGEMGIESGEKTRADLEQRKGKTSEPFSMPLDPPRSTVFSIYPIGGVEDYEAFFYGLGSALGYGFVEDDDDFEFKNLRQSTSVEVFGNLFRNLVCQPKWIKKYLKVDTTADFLRFLQIRQLMKIRYYAGKLIYEMAFHSDSDHGNKADFYEETLKHATFSRYDQVRYLADVRPHLYTASCLKGCMLEASLRIYLRENFDEQWWRERQVGDFLSKLWQEGGRITSQDIAKRLGCGELDSMPIVSSFAEILG